MDKGAIIIVGILILIGSLIFSNFECSYRAEQMGLECKWNIISGCLVKSTNGNWVEIDHYRVMD